MLTKLLKDPLFCLETSCMSFQDYFQPNDHDCTMFKDSGEVSSKILVPGKTHKVTMNRKSGKSHLALMAYWDKDTKSFRSGALFLKDQREFSEGRIDMEFSLDAHPVGASFFFVLQSPGCRKEEDTIVLFDAAKIGDVIHGTSRHGYVEAEDTSVFHGAPVNLSAFVGKQSFKLTINGNNVLSSPRPHCTVGKNLCVMMGWNVWGSSMSPSGAASGENFLAQATIRSLDIFPVETNQD